MVLIMEVGVLEEHLLRGVRIQREVVSMAVVQNTEYQRLRRQRHREEDIPGRKTAKEGNRISIKIKTLKKFFTVG